MLVLLARRCLESLASRACDVPRLLHQDRRKRGGPDLGETCGVFRDSCGASGDIAPGDRRSSGAAKAPGAVDPHRGSRLSSRAMARINENYRKLPAGYLFPEIGRRVAAFAKAN